MVSSEFSRSSAHQLCVLIRTDRARQLFGVSSCPASEPSDPVMSFFWERTLLDSPTHHCCLVVDHLSSSFIRKLVGRDFLRSVIRDKEGWLGIAQVLLARCQPNLDLVYLSRLARPIRFSNSGGHESKTTILLLASMLGRWGSVLHRVFVQATNHQRDPVSEIPGRGLTFRSGSEGMVFLSMIHAFRVMPREALDISQVFLTIRYIFLSASFYKRSIGSNALSAQGIPSPV